MKTRAARPKLLVSVPIMEGAPWAIPSHWRWATMGEVATTMGGSTPKTDRSDYFGGEIPWITPADLSGYKAKMISRGARNITDAGLANSGARMMPAGTVLFSSRAPIGYVAIAANPLATNQGFKSFVLRQEVSADFVYYYLQRAKELAVALASGTTFLEISGKNAAQIPIPVPALDEQQRIVAEIEKQFTRLEAGVASLKRVQAALKRYRASVLKAACEGHLVSSNGDNWQSVTLEEICKSISDGDHQPPPKASEGIPFLTIGNMSGGHLDFSDTRFVPPAYYRAIKSNRKPQRGDLLYSVVGATIGIPVIVDTDDQFCFQRHIAILRPSSRVLARFLWILMANPDFHREAWRRTTGSAQPTLPLKNLRSMTVELPPPEEQIRILDEVERRMSVVGYLENETV